MFDQRALEAVVTRTLEANVLIPADARGAFVTVANRDSIKAVIAVKIADQWAVKAVVEHEWGTKDVNFGVSVTGTF